jgi:hypothetical protein
MEIELNDHPGHPRGIFSDIAGRKRWTTPQPYSRSGAPFDNVTEAHGVLIVTEPQIVCPHCSGEIKLTESLAAPIVAETRRRFEVLLAEKESGFAVREADLNKIRDDLARQREAIDVDVAARLRKERASIAESEARKARLAVADDIEQRDRQVAELQQYLAANNSKLAAAQAAQADFARRTRELEDTRRELELSVERKVQEALVTVREKAKADGEELMKAKVAEKETQISGMQRQIEELRRRAEQGSQQLQGEALELELELQLCSRFPQDIIEPIAKGEFGGDVLQRVIGPLGQPCGAMIWESKRTKAWSAGWLTKLRDDQRAVNAEIALLVSSALPKGVDTFDLIDNVWVSAPRFAVPLAIALRQSLIEVAGSRQTQEGQQTKMELVYQYLTGSRFRHRLDAIIEKFTEMQEDLERERKLMTRLWAKRELQLRGVVDSTAGLYGDLQGIAGRAMPKIDGLDIIMIDAKASS